MKNNSNLFTFLSFLPALAYWYLEETQPLEIALIGGLGLAILEIILEKVFTKHVHSISKLNFFLVLFLGIISLFAKEGIWFKLQPTMTGICLSSYLIYKKIKNESVFIEMMNDMGKESPLPQEFYKMFETHLILFLLGFAAWMSYVAIYLSTGSWLFWKTGGFYIVMGIFSLVEFFLIRMKLKGKK